MGDQERIHLLGADSELPAEFVSRVLDTDEAAAATARATLSALAHTVADASCTLELIDGALRESERFSVRARQARGHVRRALSGLQDDAVDGLEAAALTFAPAQPKVPS